MKRLAAALAFAAVATAAQAADPVEGQWFAQGGSAKVKVAPCAGDPKKMCGTIVWVRNPATRDTNNPDPALKSRPLVGVSLIRDFKPAGPGKWTGGKIYDPNSGKTYASKLTANPDGTLKVEGCIAIACQALIWKPAI